MVLTKTQNVLIILLNEKKKRKSLNVAINTPKNGMFMMKLTKPLID